MLWTAEVDKAAAATKSVTVANLKLFILSPWKITATVYEGS